MDAGERIIWAVSLFVVFLVLGNFVETETDVAKESETKTESEKTEVKAEAETEAEKETKALEEAKAKEEAVAKEKAEADAKAKQEAEAKAKADAAAKEKAEAEAKAKEPISTDFSSFDDPYDDMTDLQKDDFWKGVKGKYVMWSGEIVEVTEKNIQLKMESTTFVSDLIANISKDEREKLINLNIGDTIKVKGTLSSKEGIFLPWSIDDAIIVE